MKIDLKRKGKIEWLKIVNPNKESLQKIFADNKLSPETLYDIVNPVIRSKAEFSKEYISLVFHFPILDGSHLKIQEIDFVLKDNLLITSSEKHIEVIDKYFEKFDRIDYQNKSFGQESSVTVFAYVMKELYTQTENLLDISMERILQIEKEIFGNDERKTIEHLSFARRDLFNFESSIRLHKEVLESFINQSSFFSLKGFQNYGALIMSDYYKTWNIIDHQKNMMTDLKDTNDFLLNHKTNQIVKAFTLVSFFVLPLSFIASLMGMNTYFPEIITGSFGIIYILIFMILLSTIIYIFAKTRKWL